MAMEFEIKAKFDALQKMRAELNETKRKLVELGEAADPAEISKLEAKAQDLAVDMGALEDKIGKTASAFRDGLSAGLNKAQGDLKSVLTEFNKLGTKSAEAKEKMEAMQSKVVSLTKAFHEASGNTNTTQKELDKLSKEMTEAADANRRLAAEYSACLDAQNDFRLNVIRAQVDVDKYKAAIKDMDEQMKENAEAAKDGVDANKEMGDKLSDAAAGIAKLSAVAAGAMGIKDFIGNCISARSQLQQMQTSLETMVGKDTASSLFDQLFDIAKRSPLEMTDMVGAEQMMISFGIDAQKSVKYLEALSDISMGDASKFNSLTLAFSQMSATGKLMGQDLNQMINQGFNPLEAIASKTGKTIAQLKDEMSKGQISAEMVQDAFISVTQEGGRFYGMSAASAKTLQGQMSMLEDALSTMYSTIGEKLEPYTMSAYQAATKLVENWEELVPVIMAAVSAIGISKAAYVIHTAVAKANAAAVAAGRVADFGRIASIKAMATSLIQGTAIQKGFNMAIAACPYVLVGAAIAALGYEIYKTATYMTEAEKSQDNLNKAMAEADKQADAECAKILDLDATLQKLDKTSTEYAATKKQMVEMAKKWDKSVADEIERNGLTEQSYVKLNEAIQKHYRVKAYLRWKDAEDARKQELIQNSLSDIRQNLMDKYVGGTDDKGEKARRTMEVNKAMAEISKKTYEGSLQFQGQTSIFTENDSLASLAKNAVNLLVPGAAATKIVQNAKTEAVGNLSAGTMKLIKENGAAWENYIGVGDSVIDQMTAMAKNVSEMTDTLNDEGNLAMFGLTKKDMQDEEDRQAEEERRKAEEAKRNAEKDKQGTGDDKDAKKKAEADKKAAEGLRKDIAGIEEQWDDEDFKRQAESLAKKREAIIRSYNDRRKVVEEKEKEVAEALKKGIISQEEADKMNGTLSQEKEKIKTNQNEDIQKLYTEEIKLNTDDATKAAEEYEKKRLEIAKTYAEKRALLESIVAQGDATDEQRGRAKDGLALLDTRKKADLAKVDLEEFQSGDLYGKLFQNLDNLSSRTLLALKQRFQEFGDSVRQNLSPADAQAFEDAMQRLDDKIAGLDPWGTFAASRDAIDDALQRKVKATEELAAADKDLRSIQTSLNKENKKEVKDTNKIVELQEQLSVAQSNYSKALTKLAKAEDDEKKAKSQAANSAKAVIETFKELSSVAQEVTDALGVDAGDVFTFVNSILDFGTTAIDTFSKTSEATTAAMQAAETASVVLAIAGAAIKVLTALSKFFDKDDDDTKAYKKAVQAQQEVNKMADAVRDYQDAVENAERAEKSWFSSSTLSGIKDSWGDATTALDSYNAKLNQQQVEYQNEKGKRSGFAKVVRALATGGTAGSWAEAINSDKSSNTTTNYVSAVDNLRFETQSAKKGGIFKKGRDQKTVDLRTWAKETYGSDLFDENNMIDVEMAQNIIDNYGDKLVGETKATLESLIEQADAYNEAMDEIKSSVSDMFSPVVDNLTDAIWNWLETGEDALTTFRNSASDTFKSIAQDMIKTMANKLIFAKYSEQVEELGEKYAKGEITEEELMTQAVDLTESTMQNSEGAIKTMEEVTKRIDDYAKSKGYDMTGSSEVTATSGGFETMSEDTATELSGRFTALYESGLRQEAYLGKIAEGLTSNGILSSLSITLANITSSGFNALLAQTEAGVGVSDGISDCLAQSYIALQDLNETAGKQEKHLLAIKTEIIKVRKVTDTL